MPSVAACRAGFKMTKNTNISENQIYIQVVTGLSRVWAPALLQAFGLARSHIYTIYVYIYIYLKQMYVHVYTEICMRGCTSLEPIAAQAIWDQNQLEVRKNSKMWRAEL